MTDESFRYREVMCFSPQADLIGGVVISAIGIDALVHVEKRASHLAIAALPLVLAIHQLDEAFIWLGLEGHVTRSVEHVALWIYLLIAFVLLPIYIPLAVMGYEPTARRKWAMSPFVAIGAYVAVVLFQAILRGPFGVTMHPLHLSYHLRLGHMTAIVSLYVVAVCGTLLFSGIRPMVIFGLVNFVAVIIIVFLSIDGFASVWCAWAAITSGAIALHLRLQQRRRLEFAGAHDRHFLSRLA